jgi:hypothetical protein
MVVACGFRVRETLLTTSVTQDGSVGGWTSWNNPLGPTQSFNDISVTIFGEHVVQILLAGQVAERHLASQELWIEVPDDDSNWTNDTDEARRYLAMEPLTIMGLLEEPVRAATMLNVRQLWSAISRVADELIRRSPNPADQFTPSGLVPASRILGHEDVQAGIDT